MSEDSKSSRHLTTQSSEIENIETAAQEDAGFDPFLKFKKGDYSIVDDEVPLGTEYIAHVKAWVKCWIKYVDGAVADRMTYRVAKGEHPPAREDLDDNDKSLWSPGLDDKPADPWVFQYLLPFENVETGDVVVFVTASAGGRVAVGDLCTAWARRTKKTPDSGQPIIKLNVVDMPTRKFGKVPRPQFDIVGWDNGPSQDIEVMPPDDNAGGDFETPFHFEL